MTSRHIEIKTQDGTCDAYVAYPDDTRTYPAVILYMDAFGLRPYLNSMADKLAEHGYYVLLPNLFYRIKKSPVVDVQFPLKAEQMQDVFKMIMPFFQKFSTDKALEDAGVFLDFLSQQKQVKKGKVGLTGYCLGGRMALLTAAKYPDKIAAAASFHGGNLAKEDAPDSPHKTINKIKAELYIGNADNDHSMPAEQIELLHKELDKNHIHYEMETYAGAAHGFTQADLPAYNEGALKKHWTKLFDLLDRNLKK